MRRIFTHLPIWGFLVLSIPAFAQKNALNFNGLDNSVTMLNDEIGAISPTGDFTVGFWAYVPSLLAGQHQFMSQGTFGSAAFYIGYDGDNNGDIMLGDFWMDSGIPMPVGRWTHIALTFDGSQGLATLYIDAVPVALNGYAITGLSVPFQLGVQTDGSQMMTGSIDDLQIWNSARSGQDIKASLFGTVNTTTPDPELEAYYAMDEASGSGIVTSPVGSGVQGTLNGNTTTAWVPSPIQSNSNAINFGTGHDRVDIPNASGIYDLTSGSTIEFWVNPASIASGNMTILGNRGPDGIRYSFDISSTTIGVNTSGGSGTIPYSFTAGTWYHLAFVNNAGVTTVFVNGVQQSTTIASNFAGDGTVSAQPFSIGLALNNTPGTDDTEPLSGSVDEVRVWTIPRSQSDITTFMNNAMSGSESGLVGLFGFDYGDPGGNNTGLLTAYDNTPNNNHGTLTNFTGLSAGTTSNFVTGTSLTPVPLPITLARFTAIRQGNQALLQWQTDVEENSHDFTIERSTDGSHFTDIGTVAAAGNSNKPQQYDFTDLTPGKNANYYRLKESDIDGKFTYSSIQLVTFPIAGRLVWYTTSSKTVEVYLQQGSSELYTLTDLNGRTLREGQLSGGKTDISGFPAGLYIVKVVTASGSVMSSRILIP
ncbi:MAG TPA: LamG-like jellyroll fold domain-containing protein [Puia sp.]|jgi:hypothetical protein